MEKNNNEEEFFDEREKRSAGRHAEDMDTSFVEPKKHHYFAKFIIFLLVLIIGGACAYYFIINTPKKFYITITDKLTKESIITSNKTNKDINYNYSIETKLTSNDKETQQILDIFNKIKITGITKYDNNLIEGNNNIKYKDGELLDITYMLDLNNNTTYLKLNKVLDKVIKLSLNEDKEELTKTFDTNKEDYETLINSFIKNFKLSLENANYERKITKLNNNFIFKDTLLLDETLEKKLLTKLLHDDEFLQSLSKIKNTSVSEISDELNEELANLDKEVSTLSVYRTILNNEILKIELKSEDDNLTITKEDDKYNFEIIDSNELTYKGYIITSNNSNETKLTINLEFIKEKMNIELNLIYSKNGNKIEKLNPNDAIDYTELTEEDLTKIMKYVQENKTVKSLLDDLGLSEALEQNTTM